MNQSPLNNLGMNAARYNFLQKLKTYGQLEDIPNITELNARFLHFLIRATDVTSVLEVGTANGYSTIWMADAIEQNGGGKILTLDISLPTYTEAQSNFADQRLDYMIDSRHCEAVDELKVVEERFDMVFIDARKSYYARFWELCAPLVKPNGIIVVDDVLKFREKTKDFEDLLANDTEWERLVLPLDNDDGILVARRI